MIQLAQHTMPIKCSVEKLYAYVTNMENYKVWFPGVIDIAESNSLPHATLGKQYTETLMLPNGKAYLTIEVKQADVTSLFVTEGDLEGVLPMMTMMFEKISARECQLLLKYHSRNNNLNETDALIVDLRDDLSDRIIQGMTTLANMAQSDNF